MKIRVSRPPIRVPGFRFGSATAGLKASRRPDVAVVLSEVPATAAAAFTRNRVVAAPVVVARQHLTGGRARAVIVNSGNANACTGAQGLAVTRAACAVAARALDVPVPDILPCATGKIGVQVPRARLLAGIRAACARPSPAGFWRAAAAIMTTDAFPKAGVRRIDSGGRRITIAAMAKGAGMIAPDLATLLVFACTDARIGGAALRGALRAAPAASFQSITVDGDTSTNDTVIVLANGVAGNAPIAAGSAAQRRFTAALTDLFGDLARLVVLDGEAPPAASRSPSAARRARGPPPEWRARSGSPRSRAPRSTAAIPTGVASSARRAMPGCPSIPDAAASGSAACRWCEAAWAAAVSARRRSACSAASTTSWWIWATGAARPAS